MKVLELCLSPDRGGLELYMLRTTRRLAKRTHACLAAVRPDSPLAQLFEREDLRWVPLRRTVSLLPLFAAWRLGRLIDTERIDVLHIHWGADLNLAVLAKRFARRPVRLVYTRQMAITRSKRDSYHRALYRHVDLVLVITRRLQEQARKFLPLPPESIQVLYLGVAEPPAPDPDRCATLRARTGIPERHFAIGLFGRIEPAKGQQVLIETVALLAQRGCVVHAVLLGHPMESRFLDELRAQADRLGVLGQVYFYGFHPHPDEVMNCFDCVVLTTYNETFGLVLVEAMRAGVAVLGTNAGGVPEIIQHEHTGLLVPPRDPVALADAIERLVREPSLRQRLAAAGKADADERFAAERHYHELEAMLAGPPGSEKQDH